MSLLALTAAPAAQAQDAPPTGDAPVASPVAPDATPERAYTSDGDIIVTARKRQETQIEVPVIEKVVTGETLARQGTLDLKDLTKIAPGLQIGTAVLSIGQLVSIRGVGTTSFDPGIDQSVALNIDGLPLGQGLAFSSGFFDAGQVEILKGPQSLFYGKSSTAGVVAIHTADPTDRLEVKGVAGYETEAHARRFEGVLSGPISSTLKARIAGFYSKTDGFYYNFADVPTTGPIAALGGVTPPRNRTGYGESYQVRGTLIWSPSSRFNAKLKANLVHDRYFNAENAQLKACPDGTGGTSNTGFVPFINPAENCRLDRVGYVVSVNPANYVGVPANQTTSFVASTQRYGTLEMNYDFTDHLSLTSVTGYYSLYSHSAFNPSVTGYSGPLLYVLNPRFRRRDLTEELRLNSTFTGPFNFTLGGFYQDGHVSDRITLYANRVFVPAGASGIPLQDGLNRFDIKSYSGFAQGRYNITPELEIDAGARVTREVRRQDPLLFPSLTSFGNGVIAPGSTAAYDVPVTTPRIASTRTSPEVTVSYKPTQDLNIFASYKIAYKSGSFSIATPATFQRRVGTVNTFLDNSFGDEKVSGFEAGIKGRGLDNQLNFSFAGYRYIYKGLQVGGIEPTQGSLPVIRTVNAGSGKNYGAEAEAHFRPRGIQGLTLNAAVNYTRARFDVLNNVPCYGGQTIAAGCNQQFTPDPVQATAAARGAVLVNGVYGNYFAQDLSGTPFVRAPKWNGNFGFDYELPVGNSTKLILANNNYFTSRFLTYPGRLPEFYQRHYIKEDLSVALADRDDRWEIALVGKNIANKYTSNNCSPSNYAAGLIGGEITGGNAVGAAGRDETLCYLDPGRELWIRLTIRPFAGR